VVEHAHAAEGGVLQVPGTLLDVLVLKYLHLT
jgi:hypothetical protein